MQIFLNDTAKEIPEGSTLGSLLQILGLNPAGLAIAVDESVVPRSQWPATVLHPSARILLLTASQGG
jgi:sulfur carrier protein